MCTVGECDWRCCALFAPMNGGTSTNGRGKDEHRAAFVSLVRNPLVFQEPVPTRFGECSPGTSGMEESFSHAFPPVKTAVCLAGGLRHFQRCTPQLRPFFLPDGTAHAQLALFLASWYDREFECIGVESASRELVEGIVRTAFAIEGVPLTGLWLGSFARLVHVFKRTARKAFKLFLYSQASGVCSV